MEIQILEDRLHIDPNKFVTMTKDEIEWGVGLQGKYYCPHRYWKAITLDVLEHTCNLIIGDNNGHTNSKQDI